LVPDVAETNLASGPKRPLRGGQVVTGGAVSDKVQGTGVRERFEHTQQGKIF